ncbi:DUF2884 family protein, partial [Enterococcus faecium]|uniref:DUF2884 family protein n=1 Tax=Enterococcus faecium TaxID=1352 RepID=UPI001C538E75
MDYQAELRTALPWINDGALTRVEKSRVALDKIITKEVGESSNMRTRLTKLDKQLKEQMNRIIETMDYQAELRTALPWINDGALTRVEKSRVALDKI